VTVRIEALKRHVGWFFAALHNFYAIVSHARHQRAHFTWFARFKASM